MSQMKAMEDENRRLKRMYADLSMQADLLKEALGKKATGPSIARKVNACICRGSTPRDGPECCGATWGKHRLGLPGLWGERDLLSLWP